MKVSFVISGLIKSRLSEIGGVNKLKEAYYILKDMNIDNEIVMSTYDNELDDEILKYADQVIINSDPGFDVYRVNPWPIGNKETRFKSNYQRIFKTTVSGISSSKNEVVIKSRIELLPENFHDFSLWLKNSYQLIMNSDRPLIGFFTEHYNGFIFSIDGTLGTVPTTLQIARRDVLLDVWSTAQKIWLQNSQIFSKSTIIFPVTDEQIVGMSYLYLYSNFPLTSHLNKIKRYYNSLSLIKATIYAEKHLFIWTRYYKSGFTRNRFKGTYHISVPSKLTFPDRRILWFCFIRLVILKIKKLRHILLRIFFGLKNHLKF